MKFKRVNRNLPIYRTVEVGALDCSPPISEIFLQRCIEDASAIQKDMEMEQKSAEFAVGDLFDRILNPNLSLLIVFGLDGFAWHVLKLQIGRAACFYTK
jgi:hypothetical protein